MSWIEPTMQALSLFLGIVYMAMLIKELRR